ncbi:hypothetical protein BU26DRAFT_523914 [Trematosphaeria pertusa]|uniref:4'-phosphopantetheinyl transferase domain-containing protein n=1 Tax=Trematosphaeria pertusa TaxID=390896 RepID=A0A6A6I025_9PLEO|nr:uncharacterized protein BU26DRAFT_523914 [Trematosphaeria pertusa]KAF2242920.1 hypothetical protein BU26DRAFT_523914 [Trematosphaeria pertusa]
MPPRPFPFALRVGTDICSIARVQKLMTAPSRHFPQRKGWHLHRFLARLLTWPERQYFWERYKDTDNVLSELHAVAPFLAGRWAAKEACRKACEHLGSSNGLHSIIILPVASNRGFTIETRRPQGLILRERLPDQPTELRETGEAQDSNQGVLFDIDAIDGQLCEVSISHDTHWATAVAIVPTIEEWKEQHSEG